MNYFMLTFSKNWADEFDAEGFKILSEKAWSDQVYYVNRNRDKLGSWEFGTNEGWEEETLGDFFESYKVFSIGTETAKELLENFPYGFGVCPLPMELVDDYEEEYED